MAAEISNLSTALSHEEEKILACVHCGLCLEACPTYVATSDENDGPRGRIYLMRAVKEGRLKPDSPTFETHIDRCLGCRACEAACPAGVQYGHLLEAARAEITKNPGKQTPVYRLLHFVLRHVWLQPGRLRAAFTLSRVMRDLGVVKFLLRSGIARGMSPRFEFALALLEGSRGYRTARGSDGPGYAVVPTALVSRTSSRDDCVPRVLLFKGCVTEGLFKRVNEATQRVLEVNGSATQSPGAQVCCGALHAHAGDLAGARQLARRNIEAFATGSNGAGAAPIITNAGGCGAMLVSYGHLLADDPQYAERAKEFSARVRDIGQQLNSISFRNGAGIGYERTTYDASCHLLHGQHAADSSLGMLWAIPDLNFAMLNGSDVCCGGAGVYNLLEPELSQEVLTEKLTQIDSSGARILATGNPGCHMQIAAGAALTGMKLRVVHPIELLDESYQQAGFYKVASSE
ncbi:MAG TPA: heterodisulfide reductase-related iron-sulfur binding cluster [Pyrinomonadaceae bacterium]|nr:heterodisulfide reductase-related iron-sulfur binding cluster [Pyrinomonadaceae bacterium]